jgi:hypothetical protein
MSLKAFHVLFIAASSLLAFYFALWCLSGPPAGAAEGRLLAGLASLAAGVGLVGYEAWFLKKMKGVR